MATADDKVPAGSVDPNHAPGRRRSLIRLTPEEQSQRLRRAKEVVARMEAIENGPDEDDRDFFRALDESHPGRFNLKRFYDNGPDPA